MAFIEEIVEDLEAAVEISREIATDWLPMCLEVRIGDYTAENALAPPPKEALHATA